MSPFDLVGRQVSVRVHEGVATVEVRDRLRHDGEGNASLDYDLYFDNSKTVAVEASVAFGGGERPAAWSSAGDASGELYDYLQALQSGSEPAEDEPLEGSRPPWELSPEPAVLVEHAPSGVVVRAASPCEVPEIEVQVTLLVASSPDQGGWRFRLPTLELDEGKTTWHVRAPRGHRAVFAEERAHLVVQPRRAPRLRARWGISTVPLHAGDTHLARAEVDLGVPLVDVTSPIAFVFVVDRSVSFGTAAIHASYALAERILDEAPRDSAYAVVEMTRRARVRTGPWTPSRHRASLREAIAGDTLDNGSDLEGAVSYAQRIARDAPAGMVPRVVVFTDAQVPFAQTTERLVTAFAPEGAARVHVVDLYAPAGAGPAAGLSWERAFGDESDLARAPEATGGIWISAVLDEGAPDPRSLARHLVRPTRIDRPRLVAWRDLDVATRAPEDAFGEGTIVLGHAGHPVFFEPPAPVFDPTLFHNAAKEVPLSGVRVRTTTRALVIVESPDELWGAGTALPAYLEEGEGVRVHALVPEVALEVSAARPRLQGWLWADPVEIRLASSKATARLGLALSAVNGVADELDDGDLAEVARRSGAVSRVSSRAYVPEWRAPPRETLSGWGCGGGCGCSGGPVLSGSSCAGGRAGTGSPLDLSEETRRLEERARFAIARCRARHGGTAPAAIEIEVDDQEILDVDAKEAGPLAECVEDALWSVRLDVLAGSSTLFETHHRYRVEAARSDEP